MATSDQTVTGEVLIVYEGTEGVFHDLLKHNDIPGIRTLFEDIDVNTPLSGIDSRPLYVACMRGYPNEEAVAALIDLGAKVSFNIDGSTPFHQYVREKKPNEEAILLLLDNQYFLEWAQVDVQPRNFEQCRSAVATCKKRIMNGHHCTVCGRNVRL